MSFHTFYGSAGRILVEPRREHGVSSGGNGVADDDRILRK